MTRSLRTVAVFVMLAQGLAGCDGATPGVNAGVTFAS